MRVVIGVAAAIVIATAALWFLWPTPALEVRNYPSRGTDIIAIGDSLVVGTGAARTKGFVDMLSERVGRPIVNLGRVGDTSEQVLARIDELDRYKPQVVILLVGGNDYLKRIDREETAANIAQIILAIQERGAMVLLLGVRGGVFVDNFKPMYETLSETHGTAYVSDVLAGLLGNDDYMSDQIHPNTAGYERITDRVYPELATLLQ
ncbi:arylesterase [Candidatus Nomurabacteria bacterium]|nr:arylesterase [Candidatus Nomurabacteria bacterium]